MEEILEDIVDPKELEKFEKEYMREMESKVISIKTQFEYAWCLIRSNYASDVHKGITLFEDLCSRNPEDKRDYIYYLALGYTKLKQFQTAHKYVKAFLEIEPNNQQVLQLDEYIQKQVDKETMKGAAVAGGAVLVVGGLLGLGFALAKK
jgi:fission 1 protein